jgi:2-iminobutanoate/2-iminopropanoate deaminase
MSKQPIRTDRGPRPIGPYNQGVTLGNLVFVSGMGPLDPQTGQIVGTDVKSQVRQVLANVAAILEAGGSSKEKVLKTTCFLKNMNDFPVFNQEYSNFFGSGSDFPARTTIEAARLPGDILIEIEAIAYK